MIGTSLTGGGEVFWGPGDLDAAAAVALGSGEVGRHEEALGLGEDVDRPVFGKGILRGAEEVGDVAAAGEEIASVALAQAGFDAGSAGEPVAGAGFIDACVAACG